LAIFAKIYDNENRLLPGYMVAVRFQPAGQLNWHERRNSRSPPDGSYEITSETGASQMALGEFNYKFEYRAPEPFLPDGTWEFWLTNAQSAQLSHKEIYPITPFNLCRNLYISWKLVR
jgi:hypothetical protein